MWAQYNLDDVMPALIQATTSAKVDPDTLAAAGRGQAEIPQGQDPRTIDTTFDPPVFA